MKKRFLSVLLALALCLSLLPTMAWATETHSEHNGIATAWTTNNSLPAEAGSYYLNDDVTLNSTWTVPEGTTNLCLNGHVIKQTATASVITVGSGATLNLYDCGTTVRYWNKGDNGLWTLAADQTITTDYTTTGGVITGGTGKVRDDDLSRSDGGGIYVSGTLNMTGGSIVGNVAQTGNGGGVYVNTGATFNMTGKSTISGNTAYNGAGVNSSGTFAMSGDSEITYNKGACGGGVLSDGSFTMSGNSRVAYNEGTMWGGGVEVTNSGTFAMSGNSRITNNKGGRDGGVYIAKGTFTMTGGSIDHNTATSNNNAYGGGVLVDDYNKENIIIALGGTAKITDNVKTDGTVINLNLPTGKTVNLGTKTESSDGNGVAAPTGDFKVGVTTQTAPTDGVPVKITTNGASTDTNYFSSDSADYVIKFNTDHLELAKITPAEYTVTFNMGNHGTQIDPQTVEEGNKATKPADPTKTGYTFGGWYKEAGCTNAWNFDTDIVATDTTLYAKWTRTGGGNPNPGHGYSAPSGHLVTSDLTSVTKVTVDGKAVDSRYYTVSGGNIILSGEFMKTLANGKHTVKLYDGDVVATGTMTVSGNAAVVSAKTADAGIALYGVLSVSSLLGMGWVGRKKRGEE